METLRFLLLTTPFLALLASSACVQAEDAPTLHQALQPLIAENQEAVGKAETELNEAKNALAQKSNDPAKHAAAQKKVDEAQAALETSRKKLAVLQEAASSLRERTNPSPEKQDGKTPQSGTGIGFGTVIVIIVVVILGLIGLGVLWNRTSESAKEEAGNDSIARVRLAKSVTLGAMSFIVLVSVVILAFAGINAAIEPSDKKTELFFEISKWIMATILPVVGAWVGGVMAYYFGKDNFQVASENARALVQELTPQQKLDSRKASDAGMEMYDANFYTAGSSVLDAKVVDLKTAFNNFKRERLPILDDKRCVKACLHLSTLNKYLASLVDEGKADDAKNSTLGELAKKLSWDLEKSFATVSPTDSLSIVQARMNAHKECLDVFVTADGEKSTPAKRWITNDDIIKIIRA